MLPHSLSPVPFLHKGEAIRFFKNGLIGGGGLGGGGDWKFLVEMGESQEWWQEGGGGGWF